MEEGGDARPGGGAGPVRVGVVEGGRQISLGRVGGHYAWGCGQAEVGRGAVGRGWRTVVWGRVGVGRGARVGEMLEWGGE